MFCQRLFNNPITRDRFSAKLKSKIATEWSTAVEPVFWSRFFEVCEARGLLFPSLPFCAASDTWAAPNNFAIGCQSNFINFIPTRAYPVVLDLGMYTSYSILGTNSSIWQRLMSNISWSPLVFVPSAPKFITSCFKICGTYVILLYLWCSNVCFTPLTYYIESAHFCSK